MWPISRTEPNRTLSAASLDYPAQTQTHTGSQQQGDAAVDRCCAATAVGGDALVVFVTLVVVITVVAKNVIDDLFDPTDKTSAVVSSTAITGEYAGTSQYQQAEQRYKRKTKDPFHVTPLKE